MSGGSFMHGTADGYVNHGCRCDRCREARKEQGLARVMKPGAPHGTRTLYADGCRCDLCREAHAAACRAYWASKKALRADAILEEAS